MYKSLLDLPLFLDLFTAYLFPGAGTAGFEAYYSNLWDHRVFTGPDMNEPHISIAKDGSVSVDSEDYEAELACVSAQRESKHAWNFHLREHSSGPHLNGCLLICRYILANSPFRGDTVGSTGGQWLKIPGMAVSHTSGDHDFAENATWQGVLVFVRNAAALPSISAYPHMLRLRPRSHCSLLLSGAGPWQQKHSADRRVHSRHHRLPHAHVRSAQETRRCRSWPHQVL